MATHDYHEKWATTNSNVSTEHVFIIACDCFETYIYNDISTFKSKVFFKQKTLDQTDRRS